MSAQTTLPETDRKTGAALTVWRYEIPAGIGKDRGFHLDIPAGADLMYVRKGQLVTELRAMVNTGMPMERRYFYAIEDNWPLPTLEECEKALQFRVTELKYVKSWIAGGVDRHLFEVKREREPGEEG